MQIGTVKIDGRLVLAPMAGVTDLAFRRICREHGAALTVTEMVSTKALCYQDRKTPRLLELAPDEHPAAAQIFGHEPETMAEGARIALEKSGCDIIDINMGCPAPKIAGNGDGSALMRDLPLASRVIEAVVKAVERPRYRQIPQGMGREKRQLRRIRPYGRAVRRSRHRGPRPHPCAAVQRLCRLGRDPCGQAGGLRPGHRQRRCRRARRTQYASSNTPARTAR